MRGEERRSGGEKDGRGGEKEEKRGEKEEERKRGLWAEWRKGGEERRGG